jgi:hypothetical protein
MPASAVESIEESTSRIAARQATQQVSWTMVSYGYVCPLTVLTLKSTADSLTDESEFKGR